MDTNTYILITSAALGWIFALTFWYRYTTKKPQPKWTDVEISAEGRGPNADTKYCGVVVEQPALFTTEERLRAFARAEKYNWKG